MLSRQAPNLIQERYKQYSDTLNNQEGAGPMWWFGKIATKNVLNNNNPDPKIMIISPLLFADLIPQVAKNVQSLVTKYREDRKS